LSLARVFRSIATHRILGSGRKRSARRMRRPMDTIHNYTTRRNAVNSTIEGDAQVLP
jgi:hypothetical protein